MPFNGSGDFSRVHNWQEDRDNGIKILALRMDQEFDNFQGGMNLTFLRNGLVPMTANLNLGTNYIIGLGAGSVGALPIRFADDPNTGLYLNGYNKLGLVSNGVQRLEANTTGVVVTGTSTLNGNTAVTGTLDASGAIKQAGNQVWHAGNLPTPASLGGAVFTGTVQVIDGTDGLPSIGFAADTNTGIFRTGADTLNIGTGGTARGAFSNAGLAVTGALSATGTLSATGAITQNGQQVWHAGNFNPANYAALTGAAFTGLVSFTDANFNAQIQGGNPIIGFDANDYYLYSRATNTHSMVVGSSNIFSVNAAGAAATGTLSATGAITQNGQQVWHAGNFNPANYAALTGATFTGNANVFGASGCRMAVGVAADGSRGGEIKATGAGAVGTFYVGSTSGGYNMALGVDGATTIGVTAAGVAVTGTLSTTGQASLNSAVRTGQGAFLNMGTSGLSGLVTRGTAAPSGGSDGDTYFQYV